MKLYQHVYGRVSRGIEGRSPGYQVAALTEALAEKPELIERLNRFSFFGLRGGKGDEVRYSFYRPVPGYLAFGASRYAKDCGGSVGTFTHNFVMEEASFFQDRATSPVDWLRSMPFLRSEEELPEDRKLAPVEIEPRLCSVPCTKRRELALHLLDRDLRKFELRVPMVIIPEQETWGLLAELFSLLARKEAAQMSFSTLFTEATDLVDDFHVVFVPSRELVPANRDVFAVLTPGEPLTAPGEPDPWVRLWSAHPAHGRTLIDFVDTLRHDPDPQEKASTLLPALLSLGSDFARCIAPLKVEGFVELVLSNPDWTQQYYRHGEPMVYEQLSGLLWQKPGRYLPGLLKTARALHQETFRQDLFKDLALRLATRKVSRRVLPLLDPSVDLPEFYDIAIETLPLDELCELGSRLHKLRHPGLYANQIHNTVADQLLRWIAAGDAARAEKAGKWLWAESRHPTVPGYVAAVADLYSLTTHPSQGGFYLQRYELTGRQYRTLLGVTWSLDEKMREIFPTGRVWVETIFHPDHRADFFEFYTRQFSQLSVGDQLKSLEAVIKNCDPTHEEHVQIIDTLERCEEVDKLAGYYKQTLAFYEIEDPALEEHLTRVEGRGRRQDGGFFGRFFGR